MLGTEEDKPGSSSAPEGADLVEEEGGPEDVDAEALELMGQGKRNLVVGDPPAAVQCFQEACELLASKYGETAEECGEAYYQYGCSLLELASMENGVLGNALQGVPEDSADSADSDEEEQKPSGTGSTVESADKLEDDDGDDDEGDEGAGPSADGDQKEDGDDISNFQLAWEMLELSRVIISKKEDEESQLKVSQIHLKLGELGLETEQYTQSVVDFKACLEIQKKYLDPESRLIAGTHYNLGLACSFDQKFDESIEHYRESKQLIEKRLASLEKNLSEMEGKGKEKADEKDPVVCAQKEIDELKELLPDVVSKLEDAKEMKLQATSSDGAGPSSSTSSGFAPSVFGSSSSTEPIQQIAVKKVDSVPVTDISNLVRRKRKPDETDAAADPKRSRQEENADKPVANGSGDSAVVNGNGSMANGVMNGDMNGDSKHSPEKPSEIKTKKLESVGEAPAAMETS